MLKLKTQKFRGFTQALKNSAGFTLIELLIVIAVLGILAVAVLSAINPLEQIRKASDSRRKSNAAELLNALERYNVTYNGEYPVYFSSAWAGVSKPGTLVATAWVTAPATNGLGSELKPEFATRIGKTTDYVYAYTDDELVHVCYQIESDEQIQKAGASAVSLAGVGSGYCLPE